MQLTKHTDISLRVMIHLALNSGERATIKEIAEIYNVSQNHLVKVVHELVTFGFIGSSKGRGGGIFLVRPANKIIVGDIVRSMEQTLKIVDCVGTECPLTPSCRLEKAFNEATKAFLKVLDGYTVADLVKNKSQLLKLVNIA